MAVARQEGDLFWRLIDIGECQAGFYQGILQQMNIFVAQPFSAKVLHFTSRLQRPMAEKKVYHSLLKSSSAKM
ncbi:hypothetical protein PS854_01568 [Pseudomonas fluorescens]|uniref:Uncharacterized protein n=1 Tax=Pseudomonas fluorescens TaxID=294 RepID=A0A5E7IK89_PSEFL|nr:hypothetical protein PS854_01568 [Pseudomonas fluorescens]